MPATIIKSKFPVIQEKLAAEVVRWALEEAGDPSGETSKEENKQGAADSEHHQILHLSLRRRARGRPAGVRLRHGQARVLGTV